MKQALALAVGFAIAAWSTSAAACPDWQLEPSFGHIELSEGFPNDPYVQQVTAGGQYSLAGCFGDSSLSGSVAGAPDFDLYYSTSGRTQLRIQVVSNHDTMLLVSDPNGNWLFDDDSGGGQNPEILLPRAADGLYDIWIGSFSGGSGQPGTLIITER